MEFSRQEHWSGLPFLSSEDLPDPGIESRSPALQPDSLPSEPPGKPTAHLVLPQKAVTLVVSPTAPGSETSFYIYSSNLCFQILQEKQWRMTKATLQNENYILFAPQLIINIRNTQVGRYFKPLNYLSLGET